MQAQRCITVTVTVRVKVLGTHQRERIVGVGPPVAVGVDATKAVLGGGPFLRRTGIALVPFGVVPVAVFVEVGPLRGVAWEGIDQVAVTVLVPVKAAQHITQGARAGHEGASVVLIGDPVVVVVKVLAAVFAAVSIGVVAQRGDETHRSGRTEVLLHAGDGASGRAVQQAVADPVVVVVEVLAGICTTVAVVVRHQGRRPTQLTDGTGIGEVLQAVVVVIVVFRLVVAAITVVIALCVGGPQQRPLLTGIAEVNHAIVVVVLVASITNAVHVEVKLSGVGQHGAVVLVVTHTVPVPVGERVNANHFVLAVVHIEQMTVWTEFKAHDGRGRGGDFVNVSAAFAVGGKVVGHDVPVAVFGDEKVPVVEGDAGGPVEAAGKHTPFNARDARVFFQRLKARGVAHDVGAGGRGVVGVHPQHAVGGWVGDVEDTRVVIEFHVPGYTKDVPKLDVSVAAHDGVGVVVVPRVVILLEIVANQFTVVAVVVPVHVVLVVGDARAVG